MRKIHTGTQVWEYRIGKGAVVIQPPDGRKKIVVDLSTLTGRSWNVLERGQHKMTSDGMVTPGDVKKYIEDHLV